MKNKTQVCSFSLNIIKRALSVGGRMQHNAILCSILPVEGSSSSFGYNDRRNNDIILYGIRPFDIRVAQLINMFFNIFYLTMHVHPCRNSVETSLIGFPYRVTYSRKKDFRSYKNEIKRMIAGPTAFDNRRWLSCYSDVRGDIFHTILNLTVFFRRKKSIFM